MTSFNSIANEYDAWYKTDLGNFVDEVESKHAFESIKVKPGLKVLDIGCGTGIYTQRLVDMGCSVTGVDIAGKMLEIAREKVPGAKFVESSVYALPFATDKFDLVFSMATFEFIKNAKAAYYEMKRVAKPGAQIFVGTINGDSSWGELYKTNEHFKQGVFEDASFKEPADLSQIDKKCLQASSGCVFFAPDTPNDKLNWEQEILLSKTEKPAFITALWKKDQL